MGCIGSTKAVTTNTDLTSSLHMPPMIIGEIRRYLRQQRDTHQPVTRTLPIAAQARDELVKEKELYLTVEEIAARLGEKRNGASGYGGEVDPISLYEPVYSEDGDSIYVMDQLSDSNSPTKSGLKIRFARSLKAERARKKDNRNALLRE